MPLWDMVVIASHDVSLFKRTKAICMPWMWTPIEMEKTRKRLADKGFGPDILTSIKHLNFANIDQVGAEEAGRF